MRMIEIERKRDGAKETKRKKKFTQKKLEVKKEDENLNRKRR